VLALEPDLAALARLMPQIGITGVGLAAVASKDAAPGLIGRSNREARAFDLGGTHAPLNTMDEPTVEVRFFFITGPQVTEDPVTGSFNASMAQWLIAEGHAPSSYTAAQGSCLGVQGRVHIAQDASAQVWVGGDVVTCVDGRCWFSVFPFRYPTAERCFTLIFWLEGTPCKTTTSMTFIPQP